MLVVMIKVNQKEGSVAKNLVLGGNGCEMGDGGAPPCFAFCAPALVAQIMAKFLAIDLAFQNGLDI